MVLSFIFGLNSKLICIIITGNLCTVNIHLFSVACFNIASYGLKQHISYVLGFCLDIAVYIVVLNVL